MNNNLFTGTDAVIFGGKSIAAISGNRGAQNAIDIFSLGCNAYGYISATNELAYLRARTQLAGYPYSYRSDIQVRNQIDYYQRQQNKHLIMGCIDLFFLLCRNLSRN